MKRACEAWCTRSKGGVTAVAGIPQEFQTTANLREVSCVVYSCLLFQEDMHRKEEYFKVSCIPKQNTKDQIHRGQSLKTPTSLLAKREN